MMPAFTAARRLLAKRAEWEKRKGTPPSPPTNERSTSPLKSCWKKGRYGRTRANLNF